MRRSSVFFKPVMQSLGHARHQFIATVQAAKHDPSTVEKRLSDHTIFTRTYEDTLLPDGRRVLQPWRKQSPAHASQMRVTTFNATMRGKKRGDGEYDYNNGLKLNETHAEYYRRTEENGYLFGCAARTSAIGNVLEGPVATDAEGIERFQAGLDRAAPDTFKIEGTNSWGVLTVSNRELLPQGLQKKRVSPFQDIMKDLHERIVIYTIPGYATLFTTLHLPHNNPQQALEIYAKYKKECILRNIEKGHLIGTQIDAGDYNRHPENIATAIIQEMEGILPPELLIKIKCKILYNHGGHRRADGSDTTVDASVSVSYRLSPCQLENAQRFITTYRDQQPLVATSSQGFFGATPDIAPRTIASYGCK